jgi:hypothetical protein
LSLIAMPIKANPLVAIRAATQTYRRAGHIRRRKYVRIWDYDIIDGLLQCRRGRARQRWPANFQLQTI